MRKNHRKQTKLQTRQMITREAARLMYEEEVQQYFDAKRMAAKRILHGSGNRLRPQDLPSNGEISEALSLLIQLQGDDGHEERLFAMRTVALQIMEALEKFSPRLIGSVSRGNIRITSDIDLHVFTDELAELEEHLKSLDWRFQTKQITVQKNSEQHDYTHIYLQKYFNVELSVYPCSEIRIRGRSSTDGRPIERVKAGVLQKRIEQDHPEAWQYYIETGEIAGLPA